MLSRLCYYAQFIFILSLFIIILFETHSLSMLLFAPICAVVAIIISEKWLLKETYFHLYKFNLIKWIKYTAYLLYQIFKSGFSIIPVILSGNANPTFVSIQTDLVDNFDKLVLANSITLTPGTITVDLEGQQLLVLWMNPSSQNTLNAGDSIKGELEKMIREGL